MSLVHTPIWDWSVINLWITYIFILVFQIYPYSLHVVSADSWKHKSPKFDNRILFILEMGENRRITQVRTARSVICRIHLLDGKLFEIDVDVSSSASFSQVTTVTSIHWAHGQQKVNLFFLTFRNELSDRFFSTKCVSTWTWLRRITMDCHLQDFTLDSG